MDLTHTEINGIADLIAEKIGATVMAMASTNRWLTMPEACKYAGVKSKNTIKKWINDGYIYGFKRSGDWIIDRETIDDWYGSER